MRLPRELPESDLDDLLTLIQRLYGYDFSQYARASLSRRVLRCLEKAGLPDIYALKYRLVNDRLFFGWFLQTLTVNVTEMFRDPQFFADLRQDVLPTLASYPTINIWHAGCATGEEAFSMAIWLHEAGLLSRARIYATDLNPANLDKARRGIVPLRSLKEYTQNYYRAGGTQDFSQYYSARYDSAILRRSLRQNLVFSQHNLVTDRVFNEFQLICCRNVLIYFNRELQNRVLSLLTDSLSPLGFLAIGMKESLMFTDVRSQFETVNASSKLYRRIT